MIVNKKFTKLVLFKNNVETLGYFSEQMAKTFRAMGYEVYLFDYEFFYQGISDLIWFCELGKTAMITFNFIGLGKDEDFVTEDGVLFWNQREVLCLNILVDHPFYYDKDFENLPEHYKMFCIDRDHVNYVRRFYKQAKTVEFLPLAGTEIDDTYIPFEKRKFDIIFTGNYTPLSTFEKYIYRIDEEYAAFYWRIINELLTNTDMPMEQVMEKYICLEIPDAGGEDLKAGMAAMIFIDLYVRFYFRGLVIKTLADSGYTIHTFGKGWNLLDCEHPENIIYHGSINSYECIRNMKNTKISLNIMPWFKNGGHDRIFNTMLSKSLCVTDGSRFIEKEYAEGQDYIKYSLTGIEELPDKIGELLENSKRMEAIAQNGYRKTKSIHTWKHRAEELTRWLD
ncbi:glycosyltransferase family protein [Anaerocolumna jejuensis]|uniref:glycosyltransferase family protein n=1 Tax=Anaerocolumna jejuensis TaxID=259063 RepID=UPI003F7BD2D6